MEPRPGNRIPNKVNLSPGEIGQLEIDLQNLQQICGNTFPITSREYWEFFTSELFLLPPEEIRYLAYRADEKKFVDPKKMKYLFGKLAAFEIANVRGRAVFSAEELEILTKGTV